ncbi:MAG: right-handed parallel beta-helix repeat-containing protein, partial [Cyanobacteria bacterium J06621_15]
IKDSFLLDNGSSGFSFDFTGENNNLTINDSEIFRNTEDGIEILSDNNTVGLFGVDIYDNGEWGLEVAGDENSITIGNSTFEENVGGAIVIDGDNNVLEILSGTNLTAENIVDNGNNNSITFA